MLEIYVGGPSLPVEDLAFEAWMLDRAAEGCPCFFATSWPGPVVVLGYGQPPDEVDLDFCSRRDIPVYRRLTGGTGVLHQGDLGISLALPGQHPWAQGVIGLYDRFLSVLEPALQRFEPRVEIFCNLRCIMPNKKSNIRLRAILFLDACGYSKAVRQAEFLTLSAVRADVQLASSIVESCSGQVANVAGDGVFAAFSSVGAAVDAALEIMDRLPSSVDCGLEGYRIGVHIGDTYEIDQHINGDAVNIASCIENVGAPNTVLVSRNVRDALHGRRDLKFTSIGKPFLKNIGNSIEVFHVRKLDQATEGRMGLRLDRSLELRNPDGSCVSLNPEQAMFLAMLGTSKTALDITEVVRTIWKDLPDGMEKQHLLRIVEEINARCETAELIRVRDSEEKVALNIDAVDIELADASAARDLLADLPRGPPAFWHWLQNLRSTIRHNEQPLVSSSLRSVRNVGSPEGRLTLIPERPNFIIGLLPPVTDPGQGEARFTANILVELLLKSLSETEAVDVFDFRFGNTDRLIYMPQERVPGPDVFLQCRAASYSDMLQVSVSALRPEDRKVVFSQNVVANHDDYSSPSSSSISLFVSYATDSLLSALAAGRHMRDPAAHHAAKTAISAVHQLLTMTGPGLEKLEADIISAYEVDPKPVYLAWLAYVITFQVGERHGPYDIELKQRARELSRRAIEADPDNGTVLGLLTHVHSYVLREFSIAEELMDRSLEISPYRAICWDSAAMLHCYSGRPQEAIKAAEKACSLGRHSPYRHLFDGAYCVASLVNGELERAVNVGEKVMAVQPEFKTVMRYLAAAYGHLGDRERGENARERLIQLEPDLSIDRVRDERFPAPSRFATKLLEGGLSKIGVPDQA